MNANPLSRPGSALELDEAVNNREQGIILAHPHIVSGMEGTASLTHDDGTGADLLPTVTLHTQTLSSTISTITATAATFLVSHVTTS